jgi:hypothetical protein
MTEQEAKRTARSISRKTGHTCYAIYFHGSWIASETVDHIGNCYVYRAGKQVAFYSV